VLVSDWQDHLVVRRQRPLHAAAAPSAQTVTFTLARSTVTIRGLDAGVHAALMALDGDAISIAGVLRTAHAAEPDADIARLLVEIGRLYVRGALSIAVVDGDETLCELSAVQATASFGLGLGQRDQRCRLSRFALVRRAEGGLLVESLAGGARLAIYRTELAAALAALYQPADEAEVAGLVPAVSVPVIGAYLRVMRAGQVIDGVDRDGRLPEDREPDLAIRESQDLFLHSRSRVGLTPDAIGGTFRYAGFRPPLPGIRPPFNGRSVPLPRPDLDRLTRTDPPLAAVMERRRSRREWADRPLTATELGEFLYRVFRVTAVRAADTSDPRSYEISLRPIPSAGGAHDLEVYVVAGRVADVGRGFFHYHPVQHALTEVTTADYPVSALLDAAVRSSGCAAEPPAVIVLGSRFGRLAWKYEGMAYAATLKNVGVAYTAMYLAATAMGLAGCALGSGDSYAFAVATNTKPYAESSVGEFMIGPAGPR
jgi:oxazoline/thiazoline dehydrogenase